MDFRKMRRWASWRKYVAKPASLRNFFMGRSELRQSVLTTIILTPNASSSELQAARKELFWSNPDDLDENARMPIWSYGYNGFNECRQESGYLL